MNLNVENTGESVRFSHFQAAEYINNMLAFPCLALYGEVTGELQYEKEYK